METTYSTTAPTHFINDMERLDKVLAPHTFLIEGDTYLTAEAPPTAARLHGELVSMGYANGWFN